MNAAGSISGGSSWSRPSLRPTRWIRRRRVSAFLKRRQVFALVAPYIAGCEEQIAPVLRHEGIPVIGPFSVTGLTSDPPDRDTFFVEPDLATQALALVQGEMGRKPAEAPAIVRGDDPTLARVADLAAMRWPSVAKVEPSRFVVREGASPVDLDRLVAQLCGLKTDAVLYLGPSSLSNALVVAADRATWYPRLYAPSALWAGRGDDLPAHFCSQVVLAFPRLPDDVTRAGRMNLDRLRSRHGLSSRHEATQHAVLTAFQILAEGLRRLGRQPTRAGLIDELGRLEEFETGFSRPVTFGPTRRLGSDGAYLLTNDASGGRFVPSGWIAAGRSR